MRIRKMAALVCATVAVALCCGLLTGCEDIAAQDYVEAGMTRTGGGTVVIPHGPLKGSFLQLNPNALAANALVRMSEASPVGAFLDGYTNSGPVVEIKATATDGTSVAFANGVLRIPYASLGTNPVVLRKNGMLVTVNGSSSFAGGFATTVAQVEGQYWVAYTNPAATTIAIDSLSATTGPDTGGTHVMISGSGFQPHPGVTVVVSFGGVAALDVSVANDAQVFCRTPAGTGTVSLTLTVNDGTTQLGTQTLASAFTYQPSE
jgi:hypothetical protein